MPRRAKMAVPRSPSKEEVPAKRARSPSLAFSFESVSALGPSKERLEVSRWLEVPALGVPRSSKTA